MQVKNFRRTSTTKDTNALHAVILECKLAQGKNDAFVRDVKAAPEPMAVCYSDWQVQDMKRFCTNPDEFTVMCADTTYVQPRGLLCHPSELQAHFTGRYSYTEIASATRTCSCASADEILFIQLLCFFADCFILNLHDKLRELSIPKKIADEFVRDVMGFHTGDTYQKGLVDCASVSEFDQQLARLEKVWNEREKPFCGASCPRFYHYFKQHKSDAVRYNMLTGVREAAGLGSPPSIFTTNMSESLNNVIKQHVHYKASEWPEFNNNLKRLVDAKREEVIRALFSIDCDHSIHI